LKSGTSVNCTPTAAGQNQATTFTYNAAGQITSRTAANDAYAWNGHYNLNRNYAANALNQYTTAGPVTPTYDVKGNLASADGAANYAYSTKNELVVRADTGIGFYRDPLGQLDSLINVPGGLSFHYVDGQITDEYSGASGSPTLRRYVFGPGSDEPIVQYEGADFSNKRFFVADERGSIIAITDTAGNATTINTYDEYGIPGAGNQGRFQYTGQAWLPELGMYSYKARVYSPTLGRFMQTDPAGYPDGPNWYNYVGADPINGTDPTGMITVNGYTSANAYYTGGGFNYQGYLASIGLGEQNNLAAVNPPVSKPKTDDIVVEGKHDSPDLVIPSTQVPITSVGLLDVLGNLQNTGIVVEATKPAVSSPYIPGTVKFTPERQQQVCANYNAMMRSNAQVSAAAGVTSVPGTVNAMSGGAIRPLATLTARAGLPFVTLIAGLTGFVTTLLGFASPPPGCN
jgi:RHS repeat-associated protein